MKRVQTLIAGFALMVVTTSMGYAQTVQTGPSGGQGQGRQGWNCEQGRGTGQGKGKMQGPRDGSGPRHPAGTGGGQGNGSRRGGR